MDEFAVFLVYGRQVLVDSEDLAMCQKYTWHVSDTGYVRRGASAAERRAGAPATICLHREIVSLYCELFEGCHTDHINGDKLDNRRSNLRVVEPAENLRNRKRPRNNRTGLKGVSFCKWTGRFRASICNTNIGRFDTAEEAAAAYETAAKLRFGEYKRDVAHY